MAPKLVKSHGPLTCSVETSASEVDAGMELTVTAHVSCPQGCDLTGQAVSIRDQHDVEVARAELNVADEGACVTNPCVVRTPVTRPRA